ncbi:MAG: S24 family peptidase [Gammaproteobacteria bacterium]
MKREAVLIGEELAMESQQLAINLNELLKSHNLNANQLAHLLDIPMMTIRRLLLGETTDPRISTLKILADYFNISVDSLINDSKNSFLNKHIEKTKSYFVPKMTWDILKEIEAISDIDLINWNEWQHISIKEKNGIGSNAFALGSRPSMYLRFPKGTIFILDPNIDPIDGDIVLIKFYKTKELTLRELVIDAPNWQLKPLVPSSNIVSYNSEEHQIMGINVLAVLSNRN